MAPKFPLYTVVLFFLCGMLFAPLLENNLLPYSLLVVVLGLSLLKKFRPFAFVIFLPLGAIHQQQYYELPPNHYLQYTSSKKEKTLVVSLTEALRSNDYQYRFYGHGGRLSIYSPQKIPLDLSVLRDFQIRYPVDTLLFNSFKNTFVAREFGLLVLDDRGIYKIEDWRPSHLLICSNPPLNMDRVLTALQLQVVLADGTNQPWHVERWKKSCEKKGIPFISLREAGAYKINL